MVPELLLDRSHDGRREAGVGAFVVAILHQRDRGGCRSLTVVPLTNGDHKVCSLCHRPLSFWFSQHSDGKKGERFESRGCGMRPLPITLSKGGFFHKLGASNECPAHL